MRMFVRRLAPVFMMALAPMAAVTIATPAVSSAQCANGGGGTRRQMYAGRWASGRNRSHATTAGGGIRPPTYAVRH